MLSKIFGFLKIFISNKIKEFWKMLKCIFMNELEEFMADIKEIAIQVIKEVKDLGLKDDAARKKAIKLLKQAIKDCGMEAKDSWINIAVELYYQIVKKSGI